MYEVLVALKDDRSLNLLSTACQDRGAAPQALMSAERALEELAALKGVPPWAGLFVDLGPLSEKSVSLVERIRGLAPNLKVIGLGKSADAKMLSKLMRAGLFDFLSLPLEPSELAGCLDNFLGRLGPQNAPVLKSMDPRRYEHIVGQSDAIKKVFRLVDKVAASDSTVLIHGESGTGKELIARALHQNSPRAERPLIPVNCGAIPEELLEAELFGHEKGAFTNAIRTRIGRFEMADGSSIFLDEIGDMSPKLQVKILRVLQEHEFERVGGDRLIHVDIRVIAATHVDLAKAVEDGRFREDLFYRLNVIPITMPPLRDRVSDIPLLADFFLKRFRDIRGSEVTAVDDEALRRMMAYAWPGNVRELENLMERMTTLAEEPVLTLEDLPNRLLEATEGLELPELPKPGASAPKAEAIEINTAPQPAPAAGSAAPNAGLNAAAAPNAAFPHEALSPNWRFPDDGLDFNALISDLEDKLINQALELSGGVKNQAAKLLGLNRTTLVEKMRKKGLS